MAEQQQKSLEQQQKLVLCANHCGFFGSATTNNLCSKCFKESLGKGAATVTPSDRKLSAGSSGGEHMSPMDVQPVQPEPHAPSQPPPDVADAAAGAAPALAAAAAAAPAEEQTAAAAAAAALAMLSESEHEAQRAEAAQTLVSMDTSATPVKGEASGVDEAGGAAAAEGGVLLEGPAAPAPGALEEGAQASLAAAAAAEAEAEAAPPVQKSRTRCFKCNKKVGLTGIECRCKLVFCGLHRYPESHDCGFDFKASDRLALEKVVLGGGAFSKVDRL